MQGQLACKIILCVMQSCEKYNPVSWTILWAGQARVQHNLKRQVDGLSSESLDEPLGEDLQKDIENEFPLIARHAQHERQHI